MGNAESRQTLRAGTLNFWGAFAISFGNMAPAASVLFLPQAMAQFTGTAVPLAFVFAMIASFLTAASILHFVKRFASAGAAYTFNSLAFNKVMGFVSGWMLFLAYGLSLPSNLLVFGYFSQAFAMQIWGIHLSWFLFTVAALLAITLLVMRGVRMSSRVDLVLVILETSIIVALAAAIIGQGGANGNTWAVFSPFRARTHWVGIIFGMLYGVGAFAGFEASATVAEETQQRFRTIPLAIFATIIVGGFLYILVAYAIAIGYGVGHGHALATATLPLSVLATRYVGPWMALAVELAGMASALGIALASATASARVIYTMGRDGVIPRWFATVHHRFGTPFHAMAGLALFSGFLLTIMAVSVKPYPQGFSDLVAAADVLGLTLYILVNLAWVTMWFKHPEHYHMSWLVGIVPSLLGALVMAIPLVSTIVPIPPWPLNLFLYLTFAYIAWGLVTAWLLKRRNPARLDQVGRGLTINE
ncbi:hypothetical protein BXT84_07825 [Sulfobacillus thermotolerans]|uniref:Amino acid permease n=1 Tax=Sulfobacillus thermotolerans TaxID=338644 RepID=A0ABM6RR39_9FIRM|nr:hypothetical protein BXT84_07825 [Sulfobacillus thermotolerans]